MGKTLEYVGKLAQAEGFEEWAKTQGEALIERIAREKGFGLFGKKGAVKRELWKELQLVAASDALRHAIDAEAKDYPRFLARIADKAEGLPKSEGYRPVIAVPRITLNEIALHIVTDHLQNSDELNRLKGGDILKRYFFNQLIRELDKALIGVPLSPKNPFPSEGNWLIVGVDRNFHWLSRDWSGHYYLYEFSVSYEKSDRREVEEELRTLAVLLGRMSMGEKEELLQNIEL